MAKILPVIGTILIFLVVVALAAAAGYWSYMIHHWPWWIALSMILGVFALYFLFLFLKRYFIRRNERRFIERVVDSGEVLDENVLPEQIAIRELEKSWKNYLGLLKSSHLKKKGNPVYALPWFMTMGESGVGKTTMLANAGVTASFTEIENRDGQIGPTRNCDWIFFDEAIVIDTAGRYSVPLESDKGRNEWKRLLLLLSKTRRREPLNGIILFIAADDLASATEEELRKKGQVLRNRIHSLMRTLGYRIPVSVMVTRMDRVPGFTEFAQLLPAATRKQVMGYINRDANPYWHDLLDQAMMGIDEALQKIRLTMVNRPDGRNAQFFTFPLEMQTLKKGLEPFLNALFTENNYQETPLLQGIYFGSGLCDQAPLPCFLQSTTTGTQHRRRPLSSVFARDLFTRVLPLTRWNYKPLKELIVWKRLVHNLGIMAWVCLTGFAAGIVVLSYFHNQEVHSLLPAKAATISTKALADDSVLVALEKMRMSIQAIEQMNHTWYSPFVLFRYAWKAEEAYKRQYCHMFESALLSPMEKKFQEEVNRLKGNIPIELYANYCVYSVEQSIFLQDYLNGKNAPEFSSFSRASSAVIMTCNRKVLPEVASYFPALNRSYLAWTQDRQGIKQRLSSLQKTLHILLARKGKGSSWLYTVAIADTPAIKLSDFWKHQRDDIAEDISIPGAFTAKGRKKIEHFLSAIEEAGAGKDIVQQLRKAYNTSYPRWFVHWWKRFGDNFIDGELMLQTDADWREAAIIMAAPDNPCFWILDTMANELTAFANDTNGKLPVWAQSVIGMNTIRKLSAEITTDKSGQDNTGSASPSLLEKLDAEKFKVAMETMKDINPSKGWKMDDKLKLAAAWKKYSYGLSSLSQVTTDRGKAAMQFSAWFKEGSGTGKSDSAFTEAYDAWMGLKSLGQHRYPDPFIWKLLNCPFVFLQDFAARETATLLQQKWQEEVLSAVADVGPDKVSSLLFADNSGLVWKYLQQYVDPFVVKSVDGYKARTVYGRSLTFRPEFYSVLNTGSNIVVNARPQYAVTLFTKTMEVNTGATVKPTHSVLTLQCSKDKYRLENDNFPRSLTINWSPDKCGDVTLSIGFPAFELTKQWSGSMAFARFLKEFASGSHAFGPEDFPENAGFFKKHKIDHVTISYTLSGADDIIRMLNRPPEQLPRRIIVPDSQITAKFVPRLSEKTLSEFVESDISELTEIQPLPADRKLKKTSKTAHKGSAGPMDHHRPQKTDVSWHDWRWILKQDPGMYTVQLMSIGSPDSIHRAFATLPSSNDNAVFSKTINGKRWYVLISGIFDTREHAESFIRSLHKNIQKNRPMTKSLRTIQASIRDSGIAGIESAKSGEKIGKNSNSDEKREKSGQAKHTATRSGSACEPAA